GEFRPVEIGTLKATWQALRDRYPSDFEAPSAQQLFAWHLRALNACEREQDWSAAVQHANELIRMERRRASLYVRRARLHLLLDVPDRWLKDLGTATDLDPTDPDLWRARAGAHAKLRSFHRALEDYDRALKLTPDNGTIWLAKYFVHANLEQWAEAEEAF